MEKIATNNTARVNERLLSEAIVRFANITCANSGLEIFLENNARSIACKQEVVFDITKVTGLSKEITITMIQIQIGIKLVADGYNARCNTSDGIIKVSIAGLIKDLVIPGST